MPSNVKPGSRVLVTVTADPTNEAAAKTLSRIFGRDLANRRKRLERKRIRAKAFEGRQRGGRIWMVRPAAPRLVQPAKGDTCRILATSALLNDLGSVKRFVKVEAAK